MPGSKLLFSKYMNPVFIETGSAFGDGIQQAKDAGFKTIYSIELHEEAFSSCKKRFSKDNNITIIRGDSSVALSPLLDKIVQPTTFWLDGHDEDQYPLLKELEAIKKHPIKTHTIIIDDLRMFDENKHGLSLKIIKDKIIEINPHYEFILENGHIPNDILVAIIR
jgi:hypothetical protein